LYIIKFLNRGFIVLSPRRYRKYTRKFGKGWLVTAARTNQGKPNKQATRHTAVPLREVIQA
jgi:hypothetical protein